MAQLGQRFDATAHDTSARDYPELPNGIYRLEVEASDVGPTKNGNGLVLRVTNNVIEPVEFNGRKLFNNYNLENSNPTAQEIGQRDFASLCRAIGLDAVEDSEELHFKSYIAKVALGKPSKDGQYPARAEIKRYFYPDEGDLPEPAIDAANDNTPAPVRAVANDNRPAPAGAGRRSR